jgi:hypothetical protein
MKSRFTILGALVGIALAATACGGSDDESTKAPTKAEFIKRADRICVQTDKVQRDDLKAYFAKRPAGAANQALNEKVVLAVGLPAIRDEAEELDALPAPDGDEEEVQAILDGMGKAIERAEEDPSTLVNLKSLGPFTAVGKLAGEYGFKACAFPL